MTNLCLMWDNSSKHLKGYCCLSAVVALWVGSGFVAQLIFSKYQFKNSIAMAVYSVTIGLVLLLPALWRPVSRAELPTLPQLALLGTIWLVGQILYFMSLMYLSMSTCTAISATATAFTFVFSLFILKYPFRVLSAVGVATCITGVVLASMFKAETVGDESNDMAIKETIGGIFLSLGAAVNSGVFSCLFKKWVRFGENSSIVFGCFGFISLLLGIPFIAICHATGIQTFEVPGWETGLLIVADAFLCAVVCNYFFSKAFVFLSPVIVQVGLTTTIPISFIITAVILRTHTYPVLAIVGVVLIFLSVIVVSYDQTVYENQSISDINRNTITKASDIPDSYPATA